MRTIIVKWRDADRQIEYTINVDGAWRWTDDRVKQWLEDTFPDCELSWWADY